MEIRILPAPEGDVIARGTYLGGPAYEFAVGDDGQVRFRVTGDGETVWAGPDSETFRRIVEAWQRFETGVVALPEGPERLALAHRTRRELDRLGALPDDLPPGPEPLWSLLLFEAESELG